MTGLLFTVRVDTARIKTTISAPDDIDRRPSLRKVLVGIRDFCQAELDKLGENENADGGRDAHLVKASKS